MFIENSFFQGNEFWKYIVGTLAIILAAFVGQLPMVAVIFAQAAVTGAPFPSTESDIMTFLEPNLTLFLLLLSFAFALAAVFLVARFVHGQTIRSLTTVRKKIDWNRIFFSFGVWAVFSAASILLMYVITPENFVVDFKPVPFMILAVIAILMIPLQTSAEEYLFRGYLMQGIGFLVRNRWFPLIVTSVVFGLMHIANPEVDKMGKIIMVYYIGTGLFLGIVTLMDEGLELALGFHAANNLVAALLVTSDWTAFRTYSILKDISEPEAGFDIVLPLVLIYPLLLLIFSRKYRWSGWREKLTGKTQTYADVVSEEANGKPDIS